MKVVILTLAIIALATQSEGYRYPSLSWMSVRPARRLLFEKIQMPLAKEMSKSTRVKLDILAAVMKAEIIEAKEVLKDGNHIQNLSILK